MTNIYLSIRLNFVAIWKNNMRFVDCLQILLNLNRKPILKCFNWKHSV